MVSSLVAQRAVLLFVLAHGRVWRAANVMCNLGNWGSSEVTQGPCGQLSRKFGFDGGFVPAQAHCRTPKHQARDSTRHESSSQQKLCRAPGILQAGDGRP